MHSTVDAADADADADTDGDGDAARKMDGSRTLKKWRDKTRHESRSQGK